MLGNAACSVHTMQTEDSEMSHCKEACSAWLRSAVPVVLRWRAPPVLRADRWPRQEIQADCSDGNLEKGGKPTGHAKGLFHFKIFQKKSSLKDTVDRWLPPTIPNLNIPLFNKQSVSSLNTACGASDGILSSSSQRWFLDKCWKVFVEAKPSLLHPSDEQTVGGCPWAILWQRNPLKCQLACLLAEVFQHVRLRSKT